MLSLMAKMVLLLKQVMKKRKNAIEWIVCNSDSIEKMSKNALESSKKYTWELYEENMNAVLKELER